MIKNEHQVIFLADGNLFVLFGPHIGISSSSVLGMYSRKGQLNDGSGTSVKRLRIAMLTILDLLLYIHLV
jgi:hypothetical protein